MTEQVYALEVQGDFLAKQTHAKPAQALAELIWNSLDADATVVEVKEFPISEVDQRIVVVDNGTGFSHFDARGLFSQLGGSWKHLAGATRQKQRVLHGSEGKGRLKAFALGRVVDWEVCYRDGQDFKQFTVAMINDALREVRITDPEPAREKQTGVRCFISELHKAYEFLRADPIRQELSELFATYLKNYADVQIRLPTGKLDVDLAISAHKTIALDPITVDGVTYAVDLEIIEWKNPTARVLYLCNEAGLPLTQKEMRVQVPGLNFSAYLKSPYIAHLAHTGQLGLEDFDSALTATIGAAKDAVKVFYRERTAAQAQTVVERWKAEQIYPYKQPPQNIVETIEREVFDIVAVKVNDLLPDFENAASKGKHLQLRMLRQAIEKSPDELQLILTEVLELPERHQKELAKLLRETSLAAIISASKVVTDRLKFITGIEALLFSDDYKKDLKERTQLHRLLADNTWLFGEEFALSVDDQSLTEVLRKHLHAQGVTIPVNEPVRRLDGSIGIVDLMLTRNIPCHRDNEREHLVVELKRPTVKIGATELAQIESYAFAVAKDERFRSLDTRWTFWIISNDLDDYAKQKVQQANRPAGMLYQSDDQHITIWAKTWSEVLHANRQRLKIYQSSLELSADKDGALKYIQETYAHVLRQAETADPDESDAAEPETITTD